MPTPWSQYFTEEALELTSQAAPSLDDDRLALLNDLCKRARQIAKRGDSKEQAIVVFDSLQSVTAADIAAGKTYLSAMENNLKALQEALQ